MAARAVAFGENAAIARSGRIDEDEVGEIEPCVTVVDRDRGRRWGVRRRTEAEPPRTHGAEIEPGGGGARTAVDHQRNRTFGWIGAVQNKGDVSDVGLRLPALRVAQTDS